MTFKQYLAKKLREKGIVSDMRNVLYHINLNAIGFVDGEKKNRLINALRSGEYIQGFTRLCRITNGVERHCVNGVWAEIVETVKNKVCYDLAFIDNSGVQEFSYGNQGRSAYYDNFMTQELVEALMYMNDILKFTFEEIAYVLENFIPSKTISKNEVGA